MSVLLADGAGGPAVEVRARPGATARDLLAAWPNPGLDPHGPLVVDGTAHPASTPLAACGLVHGALVGGDAAHPDRELLTVVGGPCAPTTVPLADPLLVGRGPACGLVLDHPSVAPAHLLFEPGPDGWVISPLAPDVLLDGERVATTVAVPRGALVAIGAVDLALLPTPASGPAGSPTSAVHRSVGHGAAADPVAAPAPVDGTPWEPPPPPEPPGLLTLGLPVAGGLVLAVLVHPAAAAFALLTPVVALGAHLDARRRHRRGCRRAAEEAAGAAAAEARARSEVELAAARLARRRHRTAPEALVAARTGRGLWTATDPTALLGWTDDAARAPVTLDLAAGEVLGVAGPSAWREAVARAVVVDATTRLGPRDLVVDLGGRPAAPWTWLPHRHGAGARLVLSGPDASIETADDASGLTERCTMALVWEPDGARLLHAGQSQGPTPVRAHVADDESVARAARALARWTDPDLGGGLPDTVDLVGLLPGADAVGLDGRRSLAAPLGSDAHGTFTVDLVADGPHALVAGTTGAGKSELLRTWVVSLAAAHPPAAVGFVLVDFKGGSAFDACAHLPHTAGLVTDLDPGLGERLLVALGAELRRREEGLRAAGHTDLADWAEGPPRLVVVVDEFATMAAEVPEVLSSLVDLARRGRSLGIHLVLATQRPGGAVTDDIRANTALRICLRTLDRADAQDVVGLPDPAELPADRPGRAVVRHVAGTTTVQVAVVGPPEDGDPVVVRSVAGVADRDPLPSGLGPLVDRIVDRWAGQTASPLWLPPLPEVLAAGEAGTGPAGSVVLGLIDRPAQRSRPPLAWDPADGPLVVLGGRGRGPEQALVTAVLGMAAARPPTDLHVHLVADRLPSSLADLPHLGAFVRRDDRASVGRLLERLLAGPGAVPTLLVVEGVDRLVSAADDLDGLRLVDRLGRLLQVGPDRGAHLAMTAAGPSRLPAGLTAAAATLVVLGLDDPADHALLGLRPLAGTCPPGRGQTLAGELVQLAVHADPEGVVRSLGARSDGTTVPGLGSLPDTVALDDLPEAPGVVIGLRDRDLLAAGTDWRPGTPFVVSGPPRSGRSASLALLARQAPAGRVVRHDADDDPTLLVAAIRRWRAAPTPTLVVIDGAERLDDPDGDLRALVTSRHPDLYLAVAVRADAWRDAYGSWFEALRPATHGLALGADPVRDADTWAVALTGVGPGAPPGRAVLVDGGRAEVVQVARC